MAPSPSGAGTYATRPARSRTGSAAPSRGDPRHDRRCPESRRHDRGDCTGEAQQHGDHRRGGRRRARRRTQRYFWIRRSPEPPPPPPAPAVEPPPPPVPPPTRHAAADAARRRSGRWSRARRGAAPPGTPPPAGAGTPPAGTPPAGTTRLLQPAPGRVGGAAAPPAGTTGDNGPRRRIRRPPATDAGARPRWRAPRSTMQTPRSAASSCFHSTAGATNDQDVVVNFGSGQIAVVPKNGGAPVATLTYRRIVRATYIRDDNPRWDPGAARSDGEARSRRSAQSRSALADAAGQGCVYSCSGSTATPGSPCCRHSRPGRA